jgi:uncharacterized protein (TIGR02302 family)
MTNGTRSRNDGPPGELESRRIAARVRRRLGLSRWALVWERLLPAIWPALGIAGLFVALVGIDVLPALPAWLHLAVLVGFAGALALALQHAIGHFQAPTADEAARRLEHDSGIDHRPLVAIDDRIATGIGDAGSEALWQLHLRRAAAAVRRLRVSLPRPAVARHDPRALRFAVLLALVFGGVAGHGDPLARLGRAVAPDFAGASGIPAASLEIWATPPEYTGLAPRLLTNETPPGGGAAAGAPEGPVAPLEIPAGSQLLAQLNDGHGTPELNLGDETFAFRQVAERAWRIEIAADAAGESRRQTTLKVTQGRDLLADWPLTIVADRAPTIEFAGPPEPSRRDALKIEYRAHDDFGISRVIARLTRPVAEATARDQPLELALPMSARNMRDGGTATFHDLTAHPWAGLAVEIELEARDALDQTGLTDRLTLTLPEREFSHPVAREIVDQRRLLTIAPDDRQSVAEGLGAIASRPGRYAEDLVVYMALTLARARLAYDKSDNAIETVQDLLWDTALRLEDGALSLAENDIRELQRRLQEALARDASDAEIRELTEQLRQALDRLFQALAEQLQQQLENGELPEIDPLDPNVQAFDRSDLERMLDQIEQLSATGAREAAQQLLSQMQQMLENLRNGQFAMQRQRGGNPQARQMMRDLQDILRRQQELQDRAFQQSQQNQPSQPGDAAAQEALRRQLGDLMRRLGEMSGNIPGEFGDAEQAMRRAGEALGQGQPGEAVGPQGEAVDLLRQGAQNAMQAMRGGDGPGPDDGFENTGRPGQNRDPLGRPLPGTFGSPQTTGVEVPDASDLQRAREILNELRSRAGDRMRPAQELEYLERLLRRF